MTIDEAIKICNTMIFAASLSNPQGTPLSMTKEELTEAMGMATKALEEIKQYRALGTVEECCESAEKQTAKKPDYEGDGYSDGQLVYDTWICPSCGQHYEVDYDRYDYCHICGQHIDWSDE